MAIYLDDASGLTFYLGQWHVFVKKTGNANAAEMVVISCCHLQTSAYNSWYLPSSDYEIKED